MSASRTGIGKKSLFFSGLLLCVFIVCFAAYEYTPFFKKTSSPSGQEVVGSAYKINKQALIANLEKEIRAIPPEDVAANLKGYERLSKLAPGNIRYKQKAIFYRTRLQERTGNKGQKTTVKRFIKIGYPAPRLLDAPETGQMLGRVESGSLVEILDSAIIPAGSLKTVWYQIKSGNQTGWLSALGTSGDMIAQTASTDKAPHGDRPAAEPGPWAKLEATMISDYGGKITAIDRLDINESRFTLYSGLNPEQVRQTCENIGYYIRNSTGESPVIVVLVEGIPVARAEPAGPKYQAKLLTR